MSAAPRQSAPPAATSAWKIILSVLVGVTAVGGLFYASMANDMQLYRHVDEVMTQTGEYQGKSLKIHGHVKGAVQNKKGTNEYKFTLESKPPRAPHAVEIRYTGLIPDTLKEGAEVVAAGTFSNQNTLLANHVTAQCPSKYDPAGEKKLKTGAGYGPAAGSTTGYAPTAKQ